MQLTAPVLPSFRSDSKTFRAILRSPIIAANSARRRCWLTRLMTVPAGAVKTPLCVSGRDAAEVLAPEELVGPGDGDGDGEPNRRRVEENKREGSLRVDENYMQRVDKHIIHEEMGQYNRDRHIFVPFHHTLFHPDDDTLAKEISAKLSDCFYIVLTHPQCILSQLSGRCWVLPSQ